MIDVIVQMQFGSLRYDPATMHGTATPHSNPDLSAIYLPVKAASGSSETLSNSHVTAAVDHHIRPPVKIESVTKSPPNLNRPAVIRPYVADERAGIDPIFHAVTKVFGIKTSAARKIRSKNMPLDRISDRQQDRQIL